MATLIELKSLRKSAFDKCDAVIAAAENATRALTANEQKTIDDTTAEIGALTSQIAAIESVNTLAL